MLEVNAQVPRRFAEIRAERAPNKSETSETSQEDKHEIQMFGA